MRWAVCAAIAAVFSLVFTVGVVGGGRWLYTRMGGTGGALMLHWSIPTGCFQALFGVAVQHAVGRDPGHGQHGRARVCHGAAVVLVPLSPLFIFGCSPMPGLGIAGVRSR